ncbi:MAG: PLP-dependent aminotransferase family protein [Ruminococcaceae bacterium]|nr:PLP-dependent aminotransferase family protein [Oscillospiraceae bacterium]
MKYIIDKDDTLPAYLQLYRQMREDIIKEIYPYNSKLPSKRILAEEMGLSTVTVEHAYSLLCDEGYAEAKERSGYFVIFRIDDGFASASDKTVSNTTLSNHNKSASSEFPFSVFTKTMRSVMNDFGESILEKSSNLGCIELREAIRQYLARSRGIIADTRQIIIGSGSEYLYSLIIDMLGRNKVYAIESPSYKKIEQVYKASDVKYEKLPLGNDGIESIALRESKADVLHISPYRSFPSGVTASASKRHEYMRWASKDNRYIIEDDFESEFSVSKKPEETLFSDTSKENVIYMNTFSKTISPSLRVGYMVLPEKLVAVFEEKLGFYSCTVPTFMQFVLAKLISNGDFERHINRVRRKKRKEATDNLKSL